MPFKLAHQKDSNTCVLQMLQRSHDLASGRPLPTVVWDFPEVGRNTWRQVPLMVASEDSAELYAAQLLYTIGKHDAR